MKPHTMNDVQHIAKQRGGICVAKKYLHANSKLKWRCADGHEWMTTFSSIKNQNTWCPHCRSYIAEEICRNIFESIFQETFVKSKPRWLKNRCGNQLELDGFSEKLKIAFEHNGDFHYRKVYRSVNLKKIKENDNDKLKCCKNNNIDLIVINQLNKVDTVEIVKNNLIALCKRRKLHKIRAIKKYKLNYDDIYTSYKQELGVLCKIAKKRKEECLSKKYYNAHVHLTFRCKNGHEYKMTPANYKSNYGCGKCYGRGRLSIDDAKNIALKKGGICLSSVYKNNSTKMRWECKLNHKWSASYGSIQSGKWCPCCAGRCITIDVVKKMAREKGVSCLDSEYINSTTMMRFLCKHGHHFETRYSSLRYTFKQCPVCRKQRSH